MDMKKKTSRRITVSDMAPHVHKFLRNENKVEKLYSWLVSWITLSLECGKIKPFDLLPSKADLAYHIGVSQGTIQNVFRRLEDSGFVESKQRIGTYIKNKNSSIVANKLTSKRELNIEVVKKYISENGYEEGDEFISVRKLAQILGISNSTLRLAVNNLLDLGILEKKENKFIIKSIDFQINKIQSQTLAEKVAESLRGYIEREFKQGEKIPPNKFLADKFDVSVKTVNDAIKILSREGFLYIRRGKYGTIVVGESQETPDLYDYEKIGTKLHHYISENHQVGDKLPSIKNFAEMYNTSEKTIRKALENLAMDGYIAFARGRYGGTFVLDLPEIGGEAYKWLAISTDYMTN